MSDRGGFRDKRKIYRGSGGNFNSGGGEKKLLIDENSPIVQQFRKYAAVMNEKQDKYERLVKISRDITIESKRIIFLLHTLLRSDTQKVLDEAETRLNAVMQNHFKAIKAEMLNKDIYQYLRAFSPGLQEFIEAYTFFHYLKGNGLVDWSFVENQMQALCSAESAESKVKLLTPSEFVLGVGDLTGELMRYAISAVASGADSSECVKATSTVQDLYVAMISSGAVRGKGVSQKLSVLRASLQKMERTVYTVRVRGSELPSHAIAHVVNLSEKPGDDDIDEGFY